MTSKFAGPTNQLDVSITRSAMGSRKSLSKSQMVIGLVVVLCLLLVILGLVIHVIVEPDVCSPPSSHLKSADAVSQFLRNLNVTDALDVGWYRGTGSRGQLESAIKGPTHHMFITRVSIRQGVVYAGSYDAPLFPLADWLDKVFSATGKGVQVEIRSDAEVQPVLNVLKARGINRASQSVWIQVSSPSITRQSTAGVNFTRLVEKVNAIFPDVGFAIDWTTNDCCPDAFTKPMAQRAWGFLREQQQATSIRVPADMLGKSWPNLKWLLQKSENLTLTITSNMKTCTKATAYEILNVRNDFLKTRIFYDIGQGQCLDDLKSLALTAGSALHHFDVGYDASRITWSHAVNSRTKLTKALEDGVMFLEADILLRYQGLTNQTDIPVMAHPPAVDSDITFSQWLDAAVQTDRGIKLDFKSLGAVVPSMNILNQKRKDIHQPVWINADILVGPNSNATPVDATQFLQAVNDNFPEATLSLGWKTGWTNTAADEGYSEAMVRAIDDVCRPLLQPVTFPIRAAAAKTSWCHLQWLLDQSPRYTLTIWTSLRDNVYQEDMNYIRRHSRKDQVYFDLPDHIMPDV